MPAHLESTDRAMKAEKARAGQDRRARMEDEDKDIAAPAVNPRRRWRARMNAALILKQKGKTLDSSDQTATMVKIAK